MRTFLTMTTLGLLAFSTALPAIAQDRPAAAQDVTLVSKGDVPGRLPVSLLNEVRASIDRGVDWLVSHQNANGSFSNSNFPALTALSLEAILNSGRTDKSEAIAKAAGFIKSCVKKDGGIYVEVPGRKGGGLSNYNTAICMMTLHRLNDPSLTGIIQAARAFVADSQLIGDDDYSGGFGYDKQTERPYTDLLNTYYSVEAMKVTSNVEDARPGDQKKVDLNWNETVKFIERMQNKPEAGSENAGGFFYNPTDPKAGTSTNSAGAVVFRSYGSMTYAGMLSLIHANITRDDVRVRSAFDWATRHWTLDQNPSMGDQGLYFFYNVLAKCLSAYGQDLVPAKGDEKNLINWRAELATKLVALQKHDGEEKTGFGFWRNDVDKYWEGDPVLTTAYTLIALEIVAK